MYFQCVLILALSLVQNEAAERFGFSQGSGPSSAFLSGSPKLIQGSFDTAAELAKLIQNVKKGVGDEKVIEAPTTTEDETHLQALFNAIQKKIENEGIRIHVLKNPSVLDKYKKDLSSRAVFINNPDVLDKYVKEMKHKKTEDTQPSAGFENLLLQRRNAVFRLEAPGDDGIKNLRSNNLRDIKRKRYERADDVSKRFNKVSNRIKEDLWEMSSGKKQRDMIDLSREAKQEVREYRDNKIERENSGFKNERENRGLKNDRENRGFDNERENRGLKNERENRGFNNERENRGFNNERENRGFNNERENRGLKNERENRGLKNERGNLGFNNDRENRGFKNDNHGFKDVPERFNKRQFKDYPDFQSQGNPNVARPKPSKVLDYDYDKPMKPKKAFAKDYDEGFESKKKNKDKFDDYGWVKKKGNGWGHSIGSEPRRKPEPKMNWNDKPKRNFGNNERRHPKKEEGWAPTIRGGQSEYNARSSKNNEGYGFGNTPIPFNRPRNIYVNEHGE